MKIEITTSPQNVELANFILAQAIKTLRENPELLQLSLVQVELAERFRKSLLKGFFLQAGKGVLAMLA
jgi:hypothetical protein